MALVICTGNGLLSGKCLHLRLPSEEESTGCSDQLGIRNEVADVSRNCLLTSSSFMKKSLFGHPPIIRLKAADLGFCPFSVPKNPITAIDSQSKYVFSE